MEISQAKEKIEELIKEYSLKISKFGTKILANVYFLDGNAFLECEECSNDVGAVCGSITLSANDAEDESGMCGFDLFVDIKRHKTVDDEAFDKAVSDFRTYADDFIERFEAAPDKDEFIKEESERQKSNYEEEMKKFEGSMQKVRLAIVICVCAIAAVAVISAFCALLFG